MTSLLDNFKTHFATKQEMIDLQKAMQTTTTADAAINIDYEPELQKTVYHQSPFLSYMEQSGLVTPAKTAKVGYRVKEQKTTSSFIGETADIPAHDPSIFTDKVATMKTLVYPIEVSDLSIKGVDAVDILDDEIQDGYLDMAQATDKALLQGDGSSNVFKGLFPSITTHTESNSGEMITKDQIDVLSQELIDDGGSPSAIITTAKVGRQLNDILYPTIRNIDKVQLPLGFWVTSYNAPNGASVPIIVDPNIDTTDGDSLAIIDNSSLKMRQLQAPSMIDLAKTKLSTSRVLFTWFTFYNRAEYRNAIITGIGDDEPAGN